MTCSVKACKSLRRLLPVQDNTSFHRFPKDEKIQKLWLQALNISDEYWIWTKTKYVCSKHFKAEDYVSNSPAVLKKDVVPSMLLGVQQVSFTDSPLISSITGASTSKIIESVSLTSANDSITSRNSSLQTTNTSPSTSLSDTMSKENTLKRTYRKRRSNEALLSSTSTSSSSGKRRRVVLIKNMHNYNKSPSFLTKKNVYMQNQQQVYRRKLYNERLKITRLKQKVLKMNSVVDYLKRKQIVSDTAITHINQTINDVPHLLMSRYLKNIEGNTVSHAKYPEPLRRFAATLQFYSATGYEAVRKEFALALPDPTTVRKWFSNIECDPGFLDLSFDLLQKKSEDASNVGRDLIVSLMLDEMSIKKTIEFDGKKTWGYVDVGVPVTSDQLDVAGEALVVNVVCHQAPWKLPIGYFLIKSLSGQEKCNIINEALVRLGERNVTVTSVTCDGPSAHFTMLRCLGCNLDSSEEGKHLEPGFLNDRNGLKIYGILDACHMLKLIRNNWAQLEVIKDPNGKLVKWDYIKKLQIIQEEETLNLGNKLTKRNVDFKNQKMKVSLAAQTLSQSVADAIKYLRLDILHPNFKDSEATEDFILRINRLFDILNVKNPFGRGNNSALRESNEKIWRPFLEETVQYLLRCTDVSDRPLFLTPQKTPFIGFAITIKAVCGIFDQFVKTKKLNYLLTYKLSQDHLETFFCALRSRNGWNNNPTALQFKYSFRRLLLHTRIDGRGGNCRVIDSTTVLTVPSKSGKVEEAIDLSLVRKCGFNIEDMVIEDDEYDVIKNYIPLSELSADVVGYIAGFVVRMLEKKKVCSECLCQGALGNDNGRGFRLLNRKNRGGLKYPSLGVIKICEEVEKMIRRLLIITDNKLPTESGFLNAFVLTISNKFYGFYNSLFPNLSDHFLENPLFEQNHQFLLIQNIVRCYIKIRFFNLGKRFTEKVQGTNIRKKLTKFILFSHQ